MSDNTSPAVSRLTIVNIPLSLIDDSDRMRKDMGDLDSLADSIHINGIIHPPAVIKRGDHYKLIAGGRRTAAYKRLAERFPDQYASCDFCVVKDDYSAADLALLELEENVNRKQMDWRDKVIGIAEIHTKYQRNHHRQREKWTQVQTGELLGVSAASVQNAVVLAKALKQGHEDLELLNCATAKDALLLLGKRKHAEAAKLKDARAKAALAARKPTVEQHFVPVSPPSMHATPPADLPVVPVPVVKPETFTLEYVHANVRLGDSIAHLQTTREQYDGIYTDIPYGIDVDNLHIKNIDVTAEQHDRDENIALFRPFLEGAYRVLKSGSFCVFWFDIEHTTTLLDIARGVGFRVCRWPLIAHKNAGKNEAAAYNTTKDYEAVMVLAKSGAMLSHKRSTSMVPWKWNIREREQFQHPFAKPQMAHRYLLETFFPPLTTLFDPFCGEGTGLLAMQSMNYKYVGIDLVEDHVVKARQHLCPNN